MFTVGFIAHSTDIFKVANNKCVMPGDLLPLRIGDRVKEIGIRAEALTEMWTKKIIDYHIGDIIRLPEVFLPTFCRQPFGAARNLLVGCGSSAAVCQQEVRVTWASIQAFKMTLHSAKASRATSKKKGKTKQKRHEVEEDSNAIIYVPKSTRKESTVCIL